MATTYCAVGRIAFDSAAAWLLREGPAFRTSEPPRPPRLLDSVRAAAAPRACHSLRHSFATRLLVKGNEIA